MTFILFVHINQLLYLIYLLHKIYTVLQILAGSWTAYLFKSQYSCEGFGITH
jgi:hypothetical protein